MNVTVDKIVRLFSLIVVFMVFVGIPVISIIYPLIEVLTFYPLLVSLIFSLLFFVYKIWRSERSLETILRQITAMFIVFWLLAQVSMVIAIEFDYRGVVDEYSQLFNENLTEHDELNSSWAVTTKYRGVFEGAYGSNETLPNRIITSNSGFYLGFTPLFAAYFFWFDGYDKVIVLQKKGNCGEFAIAIKTLLRDVTGLKTRVVHMEGFDHALPEIYWNESWWVFDAIFTTPNHPVKAESYAEYLKENKRYVYESLYNLKEDETKISILTEHGFNAVNVTIMAIVDPTLSKWGDKPAKNAVVEIFASKNQYDPLVESGEADEKGIYQTVLRNYGDYIIVVKSSDGNFVGILEVNGQELSDGGRIVVRLHKYE